MLVEHHQQIALRTAFLITGSHADAEEVAQDAFVKSFRALGGFRDGEPFRPWLLAIVGNEARNRRRSQRIRSALSLDDARPAVETADAPEEAVLADDARRELRDALARLSHADRTLVGCRYFLDLSEKDLAALLRIRPGTVKSRLSRALERLRRELEATDA